MIFFDILKLHKLNLRQIRATRKYLSFHTVALMFTFYQLIVYNFRYENEQMKAYQEQLVTQNNTLTQDLSQVKDELAEAESVVQECVEVTLKLLYKKFVYILISRNFCLFQEKKKYANNNNNELIKAVDTLRDQLNLQKEALQKYEGKIKRRETELKEKTQELRKLRAEAANAKLQVDKGEFESQLSPI